MDDDEPILLHEPDLMLALLRAARPGPATLDDAMARLHASLAQAHEPPPAAPDELRQRLQDAAAMLLGAAALAPVGPSGFRLTQRGAQLLAQHPDGIDQSVLAGLPEFRAFIAGRSPDRAEQDPRVPAFNAGLLAFTQGRRNDANPHELDSADHLAWECGWSEARDDAKQG